MIVVYSLKTWSKEHWGELYLCGYCKLLETLFLNHSSSRAITLQISNNQNSAQIACLRQQLDCVSGESEFKPFFGVEG